LDQDSFQKIGLVKNQNQDSAGGHNRIMSSGLNKAIRSSSSELLNSGFHTRNNIQT